jgi:hypothetical protein
MIKAAQYLRMSTDTQDCSIAYAPDRRQEGGLRSRPGQTISAADAEKLRIPAESKSPRPGRPGAHRENTRRPSRGAERPTSQS